MLVMLSVSACSSVAPDAGHEGVLIRKPILFGAGGVEQKPVKTGLKYVAISTHSVIVDMRPVQYSVDFDDLMSLDGVPLDFNASMRVQTNDSVALVSKFGSDDWFKRNLEQPFRTAVRDAVKKRGMNEMAISASAADEVDREVTEATKRIITANGLPVTLLDVTLGRANPPDAIKHQRIATAEQEQRQKTEQQGKLAEDQRKMHEESRASADRAYNEKMGISPEQYLQLEQIKMFRETCAKQGACTFVLGTGVSPLLSVK
jgi:regulator of protease activity HflC (stomatin/prohibitin superfamily)